MHLWAEHVLVSFFKLFMRLVLDAGKPTSRAWNPDNWDCKPQAEWLSAADGTRLEDLKGTIQCI